MCRVDCHMDIRLKPGEGRSAGSAEPEAAKALVESACGAVAWPLKYNKLCMICKPGMLSRSLFRAAIVTPSEGSLLGCIFCFVSLRRRIPKASAASGSADPALRPSPGI